MAAATLSEARVNIRANLAPLKAGLSKAFTMVRNALRSIGRLVRRAAKIGILGFSALSIAALKFAADAEESENLFDIAMGDMASDTRKWSKELGKGFGQSSFTIRKFVSTLNLMLKSMGLVPQNAAAMSKNLTELTFDLASLRNLRIEDAFLKIQSGITGEIEPLKRIGILVNEVTVKTWALNKGLIAQGETLTEQQKIFVRYNLIMEQTKEDQGDLVRTATSLTNLWRRMKSTVLDLGIAYGKLLIPKASELLSGVSAFLMANQNSIIAVIRVLSTGIMGLFNFLRSDWTRGINDLAMTIKNTFLAVLKIMLEATKRAAFQVGDILLSIGKEKRGRAAVEREFFKIEAFEAGKAKQRRGEPIGFTPDELAGFRASARERASRISLEDAIFAGGGKLQNRFAGFGEFTKGVFADLEKNIVRDTSKGFSRILEIIKKRLEDIEFLSVDQAKAVLEEQRKLVKQYQDTVLAPAARALEQEEEKKGKTPAPASFALTAATNVWRRIVETLGKPQDVMVSEQRKTTRAIDRQTDILRNELRNVGGFGP